MLPVASELGEPFVNEACSVNQSLGQQGAQPVSWGRLPHTEHAVSVFAFALLDLGPSKGDSPSLRGLQRTRQREDSGQVAHPAAPHGPGVTAVTQDRIPDAKTSPAWTGLVQPRESQHSMKNSKLNSLYRIFFFSHKFPVALFKCTGP